MRRKVPSQITIGDLESAARLGLWDACSRTKLIDDTFPWYVQVRVRGSIKDELRRHDWLPRRQRQRGDGLTLVYSESLGFVEHQEATRIDVDFDQTIDDRRDAELFRRALRGTPKRCQEILLRSLRGDKQAHIARDLGITPPRVNQLLARTRFRVTEKLRRLRARTSRAHSSSRYPG